MKTLMAIFATFLLSTAMARAQTPVSYSEDGRVLFTVEVPDFWSVRTGGPREIARSEDDAPQLVPRVLALEPTVDRGTWMGLMSPPAVPDLASARRYMGQLSRFLALDVEVGPPVVRRISGRPAEVFAGTGRREGQQLQFTVAAIELPGRRVAVVAAVLEAGADPAFIEALNAVFASFRAIR
ncbi:hypothetical protein HAT86_15120 [Roseovarius gahaiensis]|uniref:Uncharacterized protein n=1 Tax=Roseovarius gahaiensis TaxID=2716691 RepID=A0A967EK54_9RHOB|nr:hypothetical protein [Roseovarius gahaiensis]NHQ75782.1 hypothetical protein [Roseovarius gahaiensis]